MALTRAQTLLMKLNEELTDLRRQPLPPLNVEKAWLNGLYEGLRTISLILNDVVLAASGVNPDEGSDGKVAEPPVPDEPAGSGALP